MSRINEAFERLDAGKARYRVLATPHIGYVARDLYRGFYGDTVKNITQWLAQQA